MGVKTTDAVVVSCDNPDCPGTDLDPTERTGWLFISSEIYGEPTVQHVFCSKDCLNAFSGTTTEAFVPEKDKEDKEPKE